ncbi:hypothetical protein MJH12_02355 [bacterium]|nr:hypothetical protein [bacterium]
MTIQNVINSKVHRFCVLVDLFYDSETVSFWSGFSDILDDGRTYKGVGFLGTISPIVETDNITANGIVLTLSGIDPLTIQRTLIEPHRERKVVIKLGFRDENKEWIMEPFVIFQGRMDKPLIKYDDIQAIISIKCENRLIDMKRTKVLRYSNQEQIRKYPSNKGLEFGASIGDKQIKWRQ